MSEIKEFRVKNLDRWQHYKDRSPPWIKLHRDLLNDYDFCRLQDASKLHLMLIWLLASQCDNRLPFDEEFIASRLSVKEPVNLKLLLDKGFIEDASKTLASCEQVDIAETETETETETEYTSTTRELFDYWASVMKKSGNVKYTTERRRCIKARLKEGYTPDDIRKAIRNCSQSEFNMGGNDGKKKYDDITLICRNGSKLEFYRDMQRNNNKPNEVHL